MNEFLQYNLEWGSLLWFLLGLLMILAGGIIMVWLFDD